MKRLSRRAKISLALLLGAALAFYLALPRPLIERSRFARTADSVTIADRHGAPLRQVRRDGFDRRWVPLSEVSPDLVDAVLAVEDARFREHRGVDAIATLRAALFFLLPGRRMSGASTISQQVVKLVYGREHGLWDKPVEILRALALEREFDKDEILEQYLNRLPYGHGIVGVARASEVYFGRPVSELTLAQAALLAGIPQAPSATEPRGHLPRALARRAIVLSRLRELGWRSAEALDAAGDEPVALADVAPRPWHAPRFVDSVLAERAEGRLVSSEGALRTSLDLPLTQRARALLEERVRTLESRGVTNASALVVSNATGEILAYVGAARSGAQFAGGQLDLLGAPRQPGSTLKPFVYELFFEEGGTAASVLPDVVSAMTGHAGESYAARDFDGRERGPVSARVALSSSLNLAALDAARQVGVDDIVARLERLGMHPPPADEVGPAVVLGGADVRATELAQAYVTLARGGTRVALTRVPGASAEGERVMEPGAASLVQDILRDERARIDAFGDDLRRESDGRPLALKTGTSSGFRDAWAVVFDETFTVVVWLGDPAGHAMSAVSGFEGSAASAARILALAHERAPELGAAALGVVEVAPSEGAPSAPRLLTARVCAHTGLLAGPLCHHTADERFVEGTMPSATCDRHLADGTALLPSVYAEWIERARPAGVALRDAVAREGALAVSAPPPVVRYPSDGTRLILDPARGAVRIPLRATLRGERVEVAWEVDGEPWPEADWPLTAGSHVFVAIHGSERSAPAQVEVRSGGV